MFSKKKKKKKAVSIYLDGWPFTCWQPCDKIEVFDWKGVIKHYLYIFSKKKKTLSIYFSQKKKKTISI